MKDSQLANGGFLRGLLLLQNRLLVSFALSAASFAMMPCGTQGLPICNSNGVCLGFVCSSCTVNSVGVICFISSFVFFNVGFFFPLLTSPFGSPTVYLSVIRATSDCDASFWIQLQ